MTDDHDVPPARIISTPETSTLFASFLIGQGKIIEWGLEKGISPNEVLACMMATTLFITLLQLPPEALQDRAKIKSLIGIDVARQIDFQLDSEQFKRHYADRLTAEREASGGTQ